MPLDATPADALRRYHLRRLCILAENDALSAADKLVLFAIVGHVGDDGRARPGDDRVMGLAHVSRRQLMASRARLRDVGYLARARDEHGRRCYELREDALRRDTPIIDLIDTGPLDTMPVWSAALGDRGELAVAIVLLACRRRTSIPTIARRAGMEDSTARAKRDALKRRKVIDFEMVTGRAGGIIAWPWGERRNPPMPAPKPADACTGNPPIPAPIIRDRIHSESGPKVDEALVAPRRPAQGTRRKRSTTTPSARPDPTPARCSEGVVIPMTVLPQLRAERYRRALRMRKAIDLMTRRNRQGRLMASWRDAEDIAIAIRRDLGRDSGTDAADKVILICLQRWIDARTPEPPNANSNTAAKELAHA